MIRNYLMSGAEIKIEGLNPWVEDLTKVELDPAWIEKWYGDDYDPNVILMADKYNTEKIFVYENTWDPSDKQTWLYPWDWIQLSRSKVKAKNVFYVVGSSGDILHVFCR